MFIDRPPFPSPGPREITCAVLAATGAADVRFHNRAQDPFRIEPSACLSAGGHVFIADGGNIVCEHCSRLVWP